MSLKLHAEANSFDCISQSNQQAGVKLPSVFQNSGEQVISGNNQGIGLGGNKQQLGKGQGSKLSFFFMS